MGTATMRMGDYGQTRELFVEMITAGIPTHTSHYTTLMSSCIHGGHGEVAQAILDQMGAAGMTPNITHYTALISCNRRDLPKCQAVMTDLKGKGIEPTNHTYRELIKVHV